MKTNEPFVLLIVGLVFLGLSGLHPRDRFTWAGSGTDPSWCLNPPHDAFSLSVDAEGKSLLLLVSSGEASLLL